MSVKISNLKPVFDCPATLYLPADNGAMVAHAYSVQFKRLTTTERDALQKRFAAGEMTQRQVLDEVVTGWGGMQDEHGNPVPYSHAERVATDDVYAGLEQSMAVTWFDHAFVNQRDAAVKNSKALSTTTTA
jgi:hypothetical protein